MLSRKLKQLFVTFTTLLVALSPVMPQIVSARSGMSDDRPISSVRHSNKRVIHIKFTESSLVSLVDGKFVATDTAEATKLNIILSNAKLIKAAGLGNRQASKSAEPSKYALRNYYKVRFAKNVDTQAITNELKQLRIVETAYAEPLLVTPPSPSYQSLQTYLNTAPRGISRSYASGFPGGLGSRAKIVDIEYAWNTNHEDLTKARTALVSNGTPMDPWAEANSSANHGTATAGVMSADSNTFGVTGVSTAASLELINAANYEQGVDLTGALNLAAARTQPGDVILIELQVGGPYGNLPIEWIPAVYDAIRAITATGRIIVEPAGNGNQNLDDTTLYGTSFPEGKPDSGALMVGAGEHCDATKARSRVYFDGNQSSNYGKRIDVQGPGNCVTTTGYGNLYSAGGTNTYYTNTFAGTSSASAVVAAAAASFSSAYEALNGVPPSPLELRLLMIYTGTAQNTSPGLLQGKIGPMPNLAKLLPTADKKAPGVPTAFSIALSSNKPNIKWTAPTDNTKVTGYQIYRNGVLYKTTTATSFRDSAAKAGTRYYYKVRAYDATPNYSAFTAQLSIVSK